MKKSEWPRAVSPHQGRAAAADEEARAEEARTPSPWRRSVNCEGGQHLESGCDVPQPGAGFLPFQGNSLIRHSTKLRRLLSSSCVLIAQWVEV